MAFRSQDRWHEMRGDRLTHLKVRPWYLQLHLEPPPYGRVQQLGMVRDPHREADITADIEVLQKRIDHTLYFADLLRVVAHLGDRVEFIEQKDTLVAVGEGEQVSDVARRG